jgi:hypothetical protein
MKKILETKFTDSYLDMILNKVANDNAQRSKSTTKL